MYTGIYIDNFIVFKAAHLIVAGIGGIETHSLISSMILYEVPQIY